MTKFIDTTKGSKEKTKTVFTHYLDTKKGWAETIISTEYFEEVKYLGKCKIHGDIFSCYYDDNCFYIYKGTKGSEFD